MGKMKKPFYKKWWFWAIVVIIVIGLGSETAKQPTKAGTDSPLATESNSGETKEEAKTDFKLGEVISHNDFDLLIDNLREVKDFGGENHMVMDVTVLSKKDNYSFFGDIQGVSSDNEVIDETIIITDEKIGDPIGTAWTKSLNKDQKAKGYVAFDKKVKQLQLRSDMFGDELITIELE